VLFLNSESFCNILAVQLLEGSDGEILHVNKAKCFILVKTANDTTGRSKTTDERTKEHERNTDGNNFVTTSLQQNYESSKE
jgi:hypothetical protein